MNGAIEPEIENRQAADCGPAGGEAPADPFGDLVQMMLTSPLTLLIGPRGAATSQFARAAAIACAELRERPPGGGCGDVVVLFDQWSGDPLLALGEAIAAALSSATGTAISPARSGRRTLARTLAHWADQFGANFIIVLDQYERNLAAEPLDARNARFAEQLAEAVVESPPHSRFLVVVSDSIETLLVRLTARIGGACSSVVRLAAMPETSVEPAREEEPAQAAFSPGATAEEPLPEGFSALADEQIDSSATEAILRRRARREAIARWRNGAVAAALVIALGAGIALFRHYQAPDPGERLARALDPAPPPATVAPPPGPPSAPEPANIAERSQSAGPAPALPAAPAATTQSGPAPSASTATQPMPQPPSQAPSQPSPPAEASAATPPGATPPAPTLAETPAGRQGTSLTPATKLAKIALAPPTVAAKADSPPAFRVDAPPGPPLAAKKARAVANPENDPMLFIHIRSESQRAQARSVASGLARQGIVVSGIGVDESGPTQTDLRYYRSGERDEANYLGRALGKLGVSGLRVRQIAGHEAAAVPRHYELWLAPPKR